MRAKKIIAILVLAVILLVLGAWREILFINTNAQIAYLNGQLSNSGLIDVLSFLGEMDLKSLNILKWSMTIIISLLFLTLSMGLLRILFNDIKPAIWLGYLYIAIFSVAAIVYVGGAVLDYKYIAYTVARKFMGALQSPFPLLILIPSFHLSRFEIDS